MLELAEEITGRRVLPGVAAQVMADEVIACRLRSLHQRVTSGASEWGRNEGNAGDGAELFRHCYLRRKKESE